MSYIRQGKVKTIKKLIKKLTGVPFNKIGLQWREFEFMVVIRDSLSDKKASKVSRLIIELREMFPSFYTITILSFSDTITIPNTTL